MTDAAGSLASILAPLSEPEFFKHNWNSRWIHIRGTKGRFEHLLPWDVLNIILEQHRLDEPRLMVFRDGKTVRASSFIKYGPQRKDPFGSVPQLQPVELLAHLRSGATLVLDNVDEMYKPITDLVSGLERSVRLRANANAYFSCHESNGFDVHWDDHDVFVLQLFGRKKWQVFGATRESPLTRGDDIEKPSVPLWEGIVESGDVLYIPRGIWHIAFPINEPTLHLTVGFTPSTGIDFLDWLGGRLRDSVVFRRDLPRTGSPQQKVDHLAALHAALDEAWVQCTLDEYFDYCDFMAQPRPRFALPFSASSPIIYEGSALRVRWNVPRDVAPIYSDGTITLRANGKEWLFAAAAGFAIETLRDGAWHRITDLVNEVDTQIAGLQLLRLLNDLAVRGLLLVEEDLVGAENAVSNNLALENS